MFLVGGGKAGDEVDTVELFEVFGGDEFTVGDVDEFSDVLS